MHLIGHVWYGLTENERLLEHPVHLCRSALFRADNAQSNNVEDIRCKKKWNTKEIRQERTNWNRSREDGTILGAKCRDRMKAAGAVG